MEIFIAVIALISIGLSTASYVHRSRQKSFLKKPLKVEESYGKAAAKELGVDGVAIAGVSTFDVLYNTLKLDPDALKGIAHLHHAKGFESLGDLMSFMKNEIIKSESGEATWRQIVHKYKGYTGEQTAYGNLAERGHNLEIPESGTNEGLDVTIDGKPYNVKVTDNPRYIQEHLDKHPDIDVIANKEMAEAFGDHPRVIIDPDLSSQSAFHDTASTFEGISDVGDLIDAVPIITLAINTVKNSKKIYDGKIDLKTAAEHTLLDTTGVGIGAWGGGKAGFYIGLALAPVTGGTSAVVIPTVTTLIGSIIGVFTGKGISGWIKGRHLRNAVSELKFIASEFRDLFVNKYIKIVEAAHNYYEQRLDVTKGKIKNEGAIKRVLFPNITTSFYRMAGKRLKSEHKERLRYYENLINTMKDAESSEGGMILYAQGLEILNNVEPLPDYYNKITIQLNKVNEEKKKLS